MRCRQCDSILWQQPPAKEGDERRCSECGTPYRPSEFEFVQGKVRFECPHCATGYYGTTPKGHLEPSVFRCVGCSQVISMDECILEPEGVKDESDAVRLNRIPWLERGRFLERWFRTAVLGVDAPKLIARRLNGEPRVGAALGFLMLQVAIAVSPMLCCCGFGGIGALIGPGGGPPFVTYFAAMGSFALGSVVAAGVLLLPAVIAARLVSMNRSPAFSRDVEIVCYASGPLALSAIPFVGSVIVFWWFVASAIALAHARPEGGRFFVGTAAVIGFLSPLAVFAACVIVFG